MPFFGGSIKNLIRYVEGRREKRTNRKTWRIGRLGRCRRCEREEAVSEGLGKGLTTGRGKADGQIRLSRRRRNRVYHGRRIYRGPGGARILSPPHSSRA